MGNVAAHPRIVANFSVFVMRNHYAIRSCTVYHDRNGWGDSNPGENEASAFLRSFSTVGQNFGAKQRDSTEICANAQRPRHLASAIICKWVKTYAKPLSQIIDLMRLLRRKRAGKRMSFAKIAAELNQQKIATRTGTVWHTTTVKNILRRAA